MALKPSKNASSTNSRTVVQEPIANLLLDPHNPRFAASAGDLLQENILRVLWNEFAVDELALSIAANGYFQEEPLLVIPQSRQKPKGPYIVVEGNRRLAAVWLLRDASLRKKIKATNLPEISSADKAKLSTLPVSKYGDRDDIWRYLGFRHINGPQPWDSFSKAMYVAQVHDQLGVSLEEIANSIGDRHSTVSRLYRGYKALEQAEAMTAFQRDDRIATRFFFSHLYTALDQPEFQRFLRIDPVRSLRSNPVPRSRLRELSELMVWLYGSKAEKKAPLVARQNPDLNILREVISEPRGLAALRAGIPLQRSHEISIGDERRFNNSLVRAKEELQIANGTLATGYSGSEDVLQLYQDIVMIVTSLGDGMAAKRNGRAAKRNKG